MLSSVEYKIIQCRATEDGIEHCNQIDKSTRIKEARGLVKMHFKSHLDMLQKHEFDMYWDDFDLDEDNFVLIAYNPERRVIYSYRVYHE